MSWMERFKRWDTRVCQKSVLNVEDMGTTTVTTRNMATRHTLKILVKLNRLCRVTRFQHNKMLVVMKITMESHLGPR